MQKRISRVVMVWVCAMSMQAAAQTVLDLPRQSQQATVAQRIGVTYVTVNYSRPLVNGRQIWGGLVPYGQVWRAGANENTTIEFSDPVSVEGQPLAKGIYGLHTIPGENEWTVIFSKNATSWGSFTYNQAEDALRVSVKPKAADFHEALTYDFDEVTPNSTLLVLRWEKLALPLRVEVDNKTVVAESIDRQLRAWSRWGWESWAEGAQYLYSNNLNLDKALEYAKHSAGVEERMENLVSEWAILTTMGRSDEAKAVRDKAVAMSTPLQLNGMGRYLMSQGKQDMGFELFRINIQKNPSHWITHVEAARLATARGDFDAALKEMKLGLAGAPDGNKPAVEALVKRLQAKEDINR